MSGTRLRHLAFIALAALFAALVAWGGADDRTFAPGEPTPLWQVVQKLAGETGKAKEVEEVVEHLRGMLQQRRPRGRLSRVLDSLGNPWALPGHAADLRDLLEAPLAPRVGPDFAGLTEGVADWLDFEGFGEEEDEELAELDATFEELLPEDVEGQELLDRLSAFVGFAHDLLRPALQGLEQEEVAQLFGRFGDFSEAFYRQHFPGLPAEEGQAHQKTQEEYRSVLLKVERRRVLQVAARVMRLLEPDFQAGLAKRLARTARTRPKVEGFSGDVRAVAGLTPESRVVLGGKGRTTYEAPAALIIDLGGNDTYRRAAVVDSPTGLVSCAIDLAGDDRYESETAGPAFAVGGVALLYDRKGDDEYTSGRHGQAVSSVGFALLVDGEGDDVYAAEDYSQGYSLCGVALLYDVEGKDRYRSWSYSQGSGNGFGFSALVDGEGDDDYLADLKWPDVYGDSGPNVYHGAAQGWNLGFRDGAPQIAGGIAALIDRDGNDRYQAGNFSQGGGYYFGFGLMYDGGGDDENVGTRYSQGFGVHQAVGIRWDVAGDDVYKTRVAANCGSAWDEGVGYLIDEAGDDVYEAGGLAIGGAAQTAIAILLEGGGKDRYQSSGGKGNQGGAGSSEYHDKQSVGLLLDLGGGKDTYTRAGREDNSAFTEDWVGFFLDTKADSVEELLEAKKLVR